MRSKAKATAMAAVAVALFLVIADLASTRVDAQSAAASPAIPKLTGIWHRKGPLNGKRDPAMVPTNRAVGFEKAYENAFSPTYDCVPIPMPAVANDNYDFQIEQKPDRVIIDLREDGRRPHHLARGSRPPETGGLRLLEPGTLDRPVRGKQPGGRDHEVPA